MYIYRNKDSREVNKESELPGVGIDCMWMTGEEDEEEAFHNLSCLNCSSSLFRPGRDLNREPLIFAASPPFHL